MKVLLKKKLILSDKLIYAVSEANILKKINHPFCIKLHYCFQVIFFFFICHFMMKIIIKDPKKSVFSNGLLQRR